ncbi:unnamed protein product [Auanema sp. JU1783]|nr:unnamed protein product [Auanema sp. JU1783]
MGSIDPDARSRRINMAYPKGTFLIRLSDTSTTEGNNAIWMVDNYQLLQKCVIDRTDANGTRFYAKTERYSGWLADEPWLYFPLTSIEIMKDPTNPQNPLIALISSPTPGEMENHRNSCLNIKPLI